MGKVKYDYLFYEEGPYHIETSPLIFKANQWIGFYMTGTKVMKDLSRGATFTYLLLT